MLGFYSVADKAVSDTAFLNEPDVPTGSVTVGTGLTVHEGVTTNDTGLSAGSGLSVP